MIGTNSRNSLDQYCINLLRGSFTFSRKSTRSSLDPFSNDLLRNSFTIHKKIGKELPWPMLSWCVKEFLEIFEEKYPGAPFTNIVLICEGIPSQLIGTMTRSSLDQFCFDLIRDSFTFSSEIIQEIHWPILYWCVKEFLTLLKKIDKDLHWQILYWFVGDCLYNSHENC